MKSQKEIIWMGIFVCLILITIPNIWALDIIAGQNVSFTITTTNPVNYTIIGNSSSLEGLNIYQDSNLITLVTDSRFVQDNFTLILFEEKTREVIREVNIGGGSGSIKRIYKNNTIYLDKIVYQDKEVKGEEVIKEVPVETEVEVSKPIYKNLFLYISIVLSLILIYYGFRNNPQNNLPDFQG